MIVEQVEVIEHYDDRCFELLATKYIAAVYWPMESISEISPNCFWTTRLKMFDFRIFYVGCVIKPTSVQNFMIVEQVEVIEHYDDR